MAQVSRSFFGSRVERSKLNIATESCKTARGTQLRNPYPHAYHFPLDKCLLRVPALPVIPGLN